MTTPLAVHFSSRSPEHYTPRHIVELVQVILGEIDLDPCAETAPPGAGHVVPARKHYTQEDDGLAHHWYGRVYMNSPYGREVDRWVAHFVRDYDLGHMTAGIALLPARTDTKWFQRLRNADLCLIKGRLTFGTATSPAPFPSMLAYLGPQRYRFRDYASGIGPCYARVTV